MLWVRILLLAIVLAGRVLLTNAQATDPDPTRWINYTQSYFKIPTAENGMYRITAAELQQAGVPIGQIPPAALQLFHRGVEQAVYVDGEADGRFDTPDYLEFYGQRNDGTSDSSLYRPHSAQPHAYYSLFNDTTAYFLTWRTNGLPGKRMAVYSDTARANLVPEPYHWATDLRLFTDDYPGWAAGLPQKTEYSYYEAGEGYTGVIQQKDKPYTTFFQLTNAVSSGPRPQLAVLLTGRDVINHRVDYAGGPALTSQHLLDSVRFTGYANARFQHELSWADTSPDGQLVVSTTSRGESTLTDGYSVSYIRLRYPQKLTANNQPEARFQLAANPVGRSLLMLTDVLPNTRFWDVTDPGNPVRIGATATRSAPVSLVVPHTESSRTLFSASQVRAVPSITRVSFVDWRSRKPTYLIVSHEALLLPMNGSAGASAVQAYAQYRASAAGGSHDTLTVTLQQLFDQYSYGERHPLAIRRFARQLLGQRQGVAPYLLLIGQGRSTPGLRRNPQQARLDAVMTAGFPGSDGTFTAGLLNSEPDVPALPTGRINAATQEEVMQYLNKVKAYENPANTGLWRKTFLHLSGGQSAGERDLFRRLVTAYQAQVAGSFLGARTMTFSKASDNLVEPLSVAKPVNEGVGLITFFGHSGLDVTDLDIGFCSNDALGYRNTGRYPVLFVNGCAIGNFFFGRPTLTTDWVLTPDRGAIAAIAPSHLGFTEVMHDYTTTFYSLLADSTYLHQSIGRLQQETTRRILAQTPGGRALANAQQMVLQGDPAIRLFPFQTPDYSLTSGGLTIQDATQQPLTTLSDSVQIRAVVQNVGLYRPGLLPVRVRRLVNGQEAGVFNLTLPNTVAYQDTLTLTFPNDRQAEGQNLFEVTINPPGFPATQPETSYATNQATIERFITRSQPILIYPPAGAAVNTTSLRLTAHYLAVGVHTFELELDSTDRFNSTFRQRQRLTGSNGISYPVTLPTQLATTYYWRVRLADAAGDPGNWATGSFRYAPGSLQTGLPEGQLRLAGALPTDLQQGDAVTIPVQFTNLSPHPFTDSLLVRQTIYAAGPTQPQTTQWRVQAPIGSDTLRLTIPLFTEKLPGINRVVLTVNPRLQPESSFLNNTLDVPLFVQPDRFAPLLEVAIDGARITDGAVVSALPLIDILVADENRALIRKDTTGLDLYLQRPGNNAAPERLSWKNAIQQPAGADKAFRIRYESPLLPAGAYQLIASARDAAGNVAVPYRVRFRVVGERTLTDLRVYPNPFRTQTLFTFTLTGLEAPKNLTITLTDLAGRVVRLLSPAVRIGLNEWTWDGRSDAGALLPPGTYVYKLATTDPDGWPLSTGLNNGLTGRLILTR